MNRQKKLKQLATLMIVAQGRAKQRASLKRFLKGVDPKNVRVLNCKGTFKFKSIAP